MKTFNDIINNYVTSPDFLNKNIEDLVMFAYKEGCVDTDFAHNQVLETVREEFTKNLNPNGHDYVDLGLPSGTLWATMNIGATSPEQYGDYFAWGETTPKDSYSWDNYKYGNEFNFNTLTKYCICSDYGKDGFTDNLTELELADDAARANWGGDWRMPTTAQVEELINNTTSAWTNDYNNTGVSGITLISKTNGNTMFVPTAGYKGSTSTERVGVGGYLWCSALCKSNSYNAWLLLINSHKVLFNSYEVYLNNYYGYRCQGQSVRGVLCSN